MSTRSANASRTEAHEVRGSVASFNTIRAFLLALREKVPSAQRKADEHLCWMSSVYCGIWHPGSIGADKCICEDDELAGDGDDRDLAVLTICFEAQVYGPHIGIETGCG